MSSMALSRSFVRKGKTAVLALWLLVEDRDDVEMPAPWAGPSSANEATKVATLAFISV